MKIIGETKFPVIVFYSFISLPEGRMSTRKGVVVNMDDLLDEAIVRARAEVDKRQIDCQPIKALGIHKANVRLTIDLIPSVTIVVHREGEAPESAFAETAAAQTREREAEAFAELSADLEAAEKAEDEAERQTRKGKRGGDAEADEAAEA